MAASVTIEQDNHGLVPAVLGGGRFHALDGLRGAAVLGVMINHLVTPPNGLWWPLAVFIKAGWLGVDLFFVLSGFLITGILLRHKDARNYFGAFYWHRALRIWPVYFSLLLVVTAVIPVLNHRFSAWSFSAEGISPYWLFLSNLGLFVGPAFHIRWIPGLAPTWSLAIEEQFYIVWSVTVRFFSNRSLAILALSALLLGIALRCWLLTLPVWSEPIYVPAVFFFTPSHMDGLFVGVLLSISYWGLVSRSRLILFARCWWIFLFLTIAVFALDHALAPQSYNSYRPVMMRVGLPITALMFGAIIMHGVLLDGWVRRIFDSPVLMFFGTYSYCMYLVHVPLTYVEEWSLRHLSELVPALHLPRLSEIPQPFLFLFQLAIVTAVAAASYRWLERPMLNLKASLPYR